MGADGVGMLSRVADHLYWMSRYLERAEHSARILDVHQNLMLDQGPREGGCMQRLLRALDIEVFEEVGSERLLHLLTHDSSNPSSIASCIAAARENARQIRDIISSEMWEQVNRLYLQSRAQGAGDEWLHHPHAVYQGVKEGVQLFHGIVQSTMDRGQGWRFLQLGRYLERASSLAVLLGSYYGSLGPSGRNESLEWVALLKCATAFEAYCKACSPEVRPMTIAEFLVLNDRFPHSLRLCVDQVQDALDHIGARRNGAPHDRLHRIAGKLSGELRYAQIGDLWEAEPFPFLESVRKRLGEIHTCLYQAYIAYPVETALQRGSA